MVVEAARLPDDWSGVERWSRLEVLQFHIYWIRVLIQNLKKGGKSGSISGSRIMTSLLVLQLLFLLDLNLDPESPKG